MRIVLEDKELMPYKAYAAAACYDLRSAESIIIPTGCFKKISLGIKVEIPQGMTGILTHRSGMNSKEGAVAYGTIDEDYRGNLFITMFNLHPSRKIIIKRGDRIAQLRLVHKVNDWLEVVDELEPSERGEQGHGSSGKS